LEHLNQDETISEEKCQDKTVTVFSLNAENLSGENDSRHFLDISGIEEDKALLKLKSNGPSCKQRLSEFRRMLEQGPYGLLQKVGKT
jgi:hypothetical protein